MYFMKKSYHSLESRKEHVSLLDLPLWNRECPHAIVNSF
jgi:hypothetical protein